MRQKKPFFAGYTARSCWRFVAVLLALLALRAQAQQALDFAHTDSLTQALATQYRWAELDSVGRLALQQGADYPGLRRLLGQSALATDHPALAKLHYGRALHENPIDSTARYGLVLAYLYMNQPAPAALLARDLPEGQRRSLHLMGWQALTLVEAEASGQFNDIPYRGNAGLLRLGLGSRLSPRISLRQDLNYFGQTVELPGPRGRRGELYPIRQVQYHALLGVQLSERWRALLGYNLLSSDFGDVASPPGGLGYAALAYAHPYWTAQVGMFAGTLTDTARLQADLRLTVYPFGNLRFYGFGRTSVVRSNGRSYPNAVLGAGGKLHRSVWLEAYGGGGQVPILAELDGTYVYNLLDPLRLRVGASLLILLPRPLSLRLSFGAEQRRDAVSGRNYNSYSVTPAFAWTW